MSEDQFQAAIALLVDFFAEMRRWQIGCKKRYDDAQKIFTKELVQECLRELRLIYDRFCQYKAFPTNITFGYRPSYDPAGEKIVEVTENRKKLLITTDRTTTSPKTRIRYTLFNTPAGYKILDKPEGFSEVDQKYVPWDLLL